MTISLLIPTYRRLELLREAILSGLKQTLPPTEILIGDDSPSPEAQGMIEELQSSTAISLRYFHHSPALKQTANVDFLLRQATGDTVCLLHDDDLLAPAALATLSTILQENPRVVAAFGAQRLITHEGALLDADSTTLNTTYHRTADKAGIQPSALISALTQQFPNNGWLVRTNAAQAIGYLTTESFGNACDFVFGMRLALANLGAFYFIPIHTADYRLSNESILRSGTSNCSYHSVRFVLAQNNIPLTHPAVRHWLKAQVACAITEALHLRDKTSARAWCFGPYHNLFSLGGLKRALLTLFS